MAHTSTAAQDFLPGAAHPKTVDLALKLGCFQQGGLDCVWMIGYSALSFVNSFGQSA
jgi:hypothetical protein